MLDRFRARLAAFRKALAAALDRLEEVRKALAAFVAGLAPVALAFVPVLEALPGAVFAAASAALAAAAAYRFENRVDGWNVMESARWLRDEIAALPPDEDAGGNPLPPAT